MPTPNDLFPSKLPPPGTYWRIGNVSEHFEAHFRCPSAPAAERYAVQIGALAETMRCRIAIEVTSEEVGLRLDTQLVSLILLTTLVLGHNEMLARSVADA